MVKNGFPSEEERELVRKYVIERDLYRPPITYLKAMVIILGAIIIELCLLSAGYFLLVLNNRINKYLYYIFSVLLLFIIDGRLFAIVLIKLYQHYAPERIRRRCLLKPTCSEFAIIVIKKYGLLIGGIKTWIRLNYKCRGNVYYIDEPK